jgi:hypothetical protein
VVFLELELNKNIIFSITGFNNALSFTTIDDNDISQVEVFIRDELLNILIEMEKLECVSKNEYIHFFGHLYKFQTSKFKFQCGEIKLIKQLVKYAREKTDVEVLHYFRKKMILIPQFLSSLVI